MLNVAAMEILTTIDVLLISFAANVQKILKTNSQGTIISWRFLEDLIVKKNSLEFHQCVLIICFTFLTLYTVWFMYSMSRSRVPSPLQREFFAKLECV